MYILDLTNVLRNDEPNYYVFNPSITLLEDTGIWPRSPSTTSNGHYLIVYRVVKYQVLPIVHPWKIWDTVFSSPDHVPDKKVRPELGKAFQASFGEGSYSLEKSLDELDTTGIALATPTFANGITKPKFDVLYNINLPFSRMGEMNQDMRAMGVGPNECLLTYNVFSTRTTVEMRWRSVRVVYSQSSSAESPYSQSSSTDVSLYCSDTPPMLVFSEEKRMFDHIYRPVEKNCVFFPFSSGNVMYEIGKTFTRIADSGEQTETKIYYSCPIVQRLLEYYGADKVHISCSTPAVPVGKRWIACGHIKFVYQDISREPFCSFLKQIDFSSIQRHGKYIYTAFLFEFDEHYRIHRVSQPFIPTTTGVHIPYLLVMPTGLTTVSGHGETKLCLSYGEGDVRCKALMFSEPELNELLCPWFDYNVYFLTIKYHIQYFGYFSGMNVGDDAFVRVFKYLHQKYFPDSTLAFTSPATPPRNTGNLVIAGGGDIINAYFLDALEETNLPIVAVGVGIPYLDVEPLVTRFAEVVMRNKSDAYRMRDKYPVSWAPDLAFLLPKVFPSIRRATKPNSIGISILQTYYHPDYPEVYTEYINEMSKLCEMLITTLGANVVLIPFGVNPLKPNENDLVACTAIAEQVSVTVAIPVGDYVEYIYRTVSEMEFMVCARFHSHIFSSIHGVPFVSLTCGRKCIEFMKETRLEKEMYLFQTNEVDLPVGIDAVKIFSFIRERHANRKKMAQKSSDVGGWYKDQMANFEKKYVSLVAMYATEGTPVYEQSEIPTYHEPKHISWAPEPRMMPRCENVLCPRVTILQKHTIRPYAHFREQGKWFCCHACSRASPRLHPECKSEMETHIHE